MRTRRIGVLLLAASFALAATPKPEVMPSDLRELAEQRGCEPVAGFYENRQGPLDPPFVYGFPRYQGSPTRSWGPRFKSVSFWCQIKGDEERFRLVAYVERPLVATCPEIVYETANYPGGLWVIEEDGKELAGYATIDGKDAHPSAEPVSVLYSSYDGLADSFICHEGKWFRKAWD
jgi:hypothetical protein